MMINDFFELCFYYAQSLPRQNCVSFLTWEFA